MKLMIITLGFIIGPRINAGGRVGKSSLEELLITSDKNLAQVMAHKLSEYNNNLRKKLKKRLNIKQYQMVDIKKKIICVQL